jgi:integrase
MKDKKLLVRVRCTNRDFYLTRPKGRADYHIKFAPPPFVREQLGIECVFRSTGLSLEAPAREAAKQIIEQYWPDNSGKVAALELAKPRGEYQTLPEFIERYRTGARTVENKESVRQLTVEANIRQFIKIVETRFDAEGNRSRRVGSWKTTRIDKALDAQLWNDFKMGWLRGVDPNDRPAVDRAKRSINSTLACARSLFIDDYLPLYKGLRLPDLAAFRAVKRFKKTWATSYVPISDGMISELQAEINELRTDRPDLYLGFYFLIMLGMRRSEVCEARLEWVEQWPEGARMAIINRDYFQVKGTEGRVRIADWLLKEIRELSGAKKPLDYLIPASSHCNRCKAIQRRLSKLVRRYVGKGRTKTLHELRKHACSLALMQTGDYTQALEFSRHADVDTLRDVYTAVLKAPPVIETVTLGRMLRVLPDAAELKRATA